MWRNLSSDFLVGMSLYQRNAYFASKIVLKMKILSHGWKGDKAKTVKPIKGQTELNQTLEVPSQRKSFTNF